MNSTPRFTIGIFGRWGTGKTTLMEMIQKRLQEANSSDILVVWFDAWKYEKEKYLAIVPFIRSIELKVGNKIKELRQKRIEGEKRSKDRSVVLRNTERWNELRKGFEKTLNAFIESTNLSLSIGSYGSAAIDLAKFRDVLKADGQPIKVHNERIFAHNIHVTGYIKNSLSMLRDPDLGGNKNSRIVAFIDDLDRCTPDNALELLESMKSFFDIEGIVYVIGMDSANINSIVNRKYGDDFSKESDYMQKIVQLPFNISNLEGRRHI